MLSAAFFISAFVLSSLLSIWHFGIVVLCTVFHDVMTHFHQFTWRSRTRTSVEKRILTSTHPFKCLRKPSTICRKGSFELNCVTKQVKSDVWFTSWKHFFPGFYTCAVNECQWQIDNRIKFLFNLLFWFSHDANFRGFNPRIPLQLPRFPPILQLEEIEHGREGIERVIEEQKRNGENHEPIGQSQGGAETEKSAKDDHS